MRVAGAGSLMGNRRIREGPPRLDFGAQHWYTRVNRVDNKPLILLDLLMLSGNPSLSDTRPKTSGNPGKIGLFSQTR